MLNQVAANLTRFGLQALLTSLLAILASIVTLGILLGPTWVGWSKALLVAWREGRWDWGLVWRSFNWSNLALGYLYFLYLLLGIVLAGVMLGFASGLGLGGGVLEPNEPVFIVTVVLIGAVVFMPTAYLGFMVADNPQRGLFANIVEAARLAFRLVLPTLVLALVITAPPFFGGVWNLVGFIAGVVAYFPLLGLYESSRSVGEFASTV
jgi:hypothetical protein